MPNNRVAWMILPREPADDVDAAEPPRFGAGPWDGVLPPPPPGWVPGSATADGDDDRPESG